MGEIVNITIYKRNGDVRYNLNSYTQLCAIKSAEQKRELLGEDTITIKTTSAEPMECMVGDYIIVFGSTYTLNKAPEISRTGEREYETTYNFEGLQYKLLDAQYRNADANGNNPTANFSIVANMQLLMEVLISNVNRVAATNEEVWVLGDCPTTEYKDFTYNNQNCLQVLQSACEEFSTEFEIVTTTPKHYTLHVRKAGSVFPSSIIFDYSKHSGVYKLKRKNINSSDVITRLYVEGGNKNIGKSYKNGSERLRLSTPAESYIDNETAIEAFGIKEGSRQYDDIYPHRTGEVTAIVADNKLQFVDAGMFDLNAKDSAGNTLYLIDGTAAKVKFTGNSALAGYTFEIHKYEHSTHTFTLVEYEDKRGLKLPNDSGAYSIAVNDSYVLLDIVMPQIYIDDAEAELLEKGTDDLDKDSQPKVSYELEIASMSLEKNFGEAGSIVNVFALGDYIHVVDAELNVDKSIRVKGYTRDCYSDPYKYKLTLSDILEVSIIERLIKDNEEQKNVIAINNLTDIAKARSNWKTTQELLNMVFDSDGYFDAGNIKPESIQTMMLSVGNRAGQFILRNIVLIANAPTSSGTNANRFEIASNSGVLMHYAIEETDRTWSMPEYTAMLTDNSARYVYAKCPKSGNTGSWSCSTSKLATDGGDGYYYFLVAVLSSVTNGYREITTMYGATRIAGRCINCGRIESIDGNTYFDLDNGEIGGRIKFISTDGSSKNVTALENAIAGNSNLIGQLQAAVSSATGDISDLEQQIGEIDTEVVNLQGITGTKTRMYITASESVPPATSYNAGELWLMKDTYKIKICINSSTSGYKASDWQWAGYTDDEVANEAMDKLTDLADDMKITPAEKIQLDTEMKQLTADYVVVLAQVRAAGVSTTTLEQKYAALIRYTNAILTNMSTTTSVVRGTYNSHFTDYYTARATALKNHTNIIESGISEHGTTLEEIEAYISGQGDSIQALQELTEQLKDQIDGAIEYWYGNVVPTLSNYPVNTWQQATYDEHLGDLYTDTTSGLEYRFSKEKSGSTYIYKWVQTASTGVGTAIQKAAEALAAANGKNHTFVTANADTTPPPTYKKGDMWLIISTLKIRVCVTDGDGVSYNPAHWIDAGYTDDTAANAAQAAIDAMADDSVITPAEKLELNSKWLELAADYAILIAEATAAKVSTTDIENLYDTALKPMVEGLLEDMSETSEVDRTYYNTLFTNYYEERAKLRQKLTNAKTRVYVTANATTYPDTTSYKQGDLWLMLDTYKIKVCKQSCSGTFKITDWADAGYTDDTQANIANAMLADMASDSKITPAEKVQLKAEMSNITADFTALSTQATSMGVTTTNFEAAYAALNTYVATILSNMGTTSTVTKSVYNSKFNGYYTERSKLIAQMSLQKARTYITTSSSVKPSTTTYKAGDLWLTTNDYKIKICVSDCSGTWKDTDWKNAGYTDDTQANIANAMLAAMASDSKITPAEKLQLETELGNIRADYTATKTKAEAMGVSVTEFNAAFTDLATYLGTLLLNMSTTSEVDREEYDGYFQAYYTAKANILDAIAKKSASDAVDDLEIGQGNYIANGAFFTDFAGWEIVADSIDVYTDSIMGNVMRLGKTGATARGWVTTKWGTEGGNLLVPNNKFATGHKYTLAFWVKASRNVTFNVGIMDPTGQYAVATYKSVVANNEWQRIVYTFTAADQSREDTRLYIRIEDTTIFEYMLLTKFVLVEGTKAPEWTDSSREFKAQLDANKVTLKAITDNYTQIDGGLILSTFLKLGAVIASGIYKESAGVKAMMDSVNEVAAYFGGTLAEAIAGTKDGMTVIYHNGKLKAKNAEITGKIYATDGEFAGSLKGVTGTFKSLDSVDASGNIKGRLVFNSTYGLTCESMDFGHQGTKNGRTLRFYASSILCRGMFGSVARYVMVVYGSYGFVHTEGLNSETKTRVNFELKTDSGGHTYYELPLYGFSGDASGTPVDVVQFFITNDTNYRYLLQATAGKKVLLFNANDDKGNVLIAHNGRYDTITGGACEEWYYGGRMYIYPANSALGAGWVKTSHFDNDW